MIRMGEFEWLVMYALTRMGQVKGLAVMHGAHGGKATHETQMLEGCS